MASKKHDDFSINTIIGPNSAIHGDVQSGGFTRADGSLRGNLDAKGRIIVGERARIKGNVSGTALVVGGVVFGSVIASESLTVLSTGLVYGDIITRRIQADEGCLIHGRVTVCHDNEQWEKALTDHRDAQRIRSTLNAYSANLPAR